MKVNGLKYLSNEEIESKALEVAEKWYPHVLKKIWSFPLDEFCEKIEKNFRGKPGVSYPVMLVQGYLPLKLGVTNTSSFRGKID